MPFELDTATVDRARSNPEDLDRLLTIVWPEAYRIAVSILQDRGLAEDSAPEACVAIAGSIRTLTTTAAFRSWCYKIIVNRAITAARRRDRQRLAISELTRLEPTSDDIDTIDLHQALARLSHKQRGAVILHYYVGLSSREIADATGIPRSTIRFHLMLARRRLRSALTPDDEHPNSKSEEALPDVH